jgi:hypothetical protein
VRIEALDDRGGGGGGFFFFFFFFGGWTKLLSCIQAGTNVIHTDGCFVNDHMEVLYGSIHRWTELPGLLICPLVGKSLVSFHISSHAWSRLTSQLESPQSGVANLLSLEL